MEIKVVTDTEDRYEFELTFMHFGIDIGLRGMFEPPYFENLRSKFSGKELEDIILQSKLNLQIDVYNDALKRILKEGDKIYKEKPIELTLHELLFITEHMNKPEDFINGTLSGGSSCEDPSRQMCISYRDIYIFFKIKTIGHEFNDGEHIDTYEWQPMKDIIIKST